MVAVIKEVCIFILVTRAVLFFVPGSSYAKYVRVLVGIMMILKMTEPVLSLFLDEKERAEILERVEALEQEIAQNERELKVEDCEGEIFREAEGELKKRLEECDSGYEVVDVQLKKDGSGLVLTLSQEKEAGRQEEIWVEPIRLGENQGKAAHAEEAERSDEMEESEKPGELEALQELYGSCLGVEAERVGIVFR